MMNGKNIALPEWVPPADGDLDDENVLLDYGVSKDKRGHIVIKLGPYSEFKMKRDSAIKFACLVLKYAGADVKFD